ncbi:MAG: hypothetical protein JWR19_4010 [Pedosphaera sp.]|nr:hypothetical protein [Pedosphaera sp.]
MKLKHLFILTVVSACATLNLHAAPPGGTLWLENWDANHGNGFGIYEDHGVGGIVAARAGTFVQVWGGASPDAMFPITAFAGTNTFAIDPRDLNGNGPGTGSFFDGGYGFISTVPPLGLAYLQVFTWSGASSFVLAQQTFGAWWGESQVWTQNLGDNPAAPNTPNPAILNVPGPIVEVAPEPSTWALAGLGGVALFVLRRRGLVQAQRNGYDGYCDKPIR